MWSHLLSIVIATTRLLIATNDTRGSCATSSMDIRDTRDDTDKTMCGGCVCRCRLCDLGELTSPPQRARMHRIRIYQNLQYTAARCMTTCPPRMHHTPLLLLACRYRAQRNGNVCLLRNTQTKFNPDQHADSSYYFLRNSELVLRTRRMSIRQ